MGSASSLHTSIDSKLLEADAPPMPDFALYEVLRNLQLSPDTIDKSVAAIYAHVRDPVEHTVDKDLARLCASDYTRGALHALSWYLFAMSNLQAKQDTALEGGQYSARYMRLLSPTPPAPRGLAVPGAQQRQAAAVEADTDGGGHTSAGRMTGRLATIFNRLRRTRSMPSRQQAGVVSNDASYRGNGGDYHNDGGDYDNNDFDEDDVHDGRPKSPPSPVSDFAPFPYVSGGSAAQGYHGAPIPNVDSRNLRSSRSPRSAQSSRTSQNSRSPTSPTSLRKSNFLAGFRLGSPSPTGMAGVTDLRRAPVKTGQWKLGHEIGKGSFGTVHIGLNEENGDLIAVKVLSLSDADTAEPLYREIELMRQLKHPNIVSYLGAEVRTKHTINTYILYVGTAVGTYQVCMYCCAQQAVHNNTRQQRRQQHTQVLL